MGLRFQTAKLGHWWLESALVRVETAENLGWIYFKRAATVRYNVVTTGSLPVELLSFVVE